MNVGITGNEFAINALVPIAGQEKIDARDLITASGFVDVYALGQDSNSVRISILDGGTAQVDVEAGALPFSDYFEVKARKSVVNFGVPVSQADLRVVLLAGLIRRAAR